MAALKQKWHWFINVVVGMRAIWFIFGIVDLQFRYQQFSRMNDIHWSSSLIWLMTAGLVVSFSVPITLYLMPKVPRAWPIAVELVISGGMYLCYSTSTEAGFNFFNIPVITLGFISIGWGALWSFLVAVGVLPALSAWIWEFSWISKGDEIFNLAVLFGIGFCFQKLVASYQKINGMYGIIQQQNQTLELYSKQIEKLTLAEERNRLSRDLHDTVGHTFTTTIVGMDAVYYLIDLSPEEAKKSLKELLHVTRNGLDEVRRHIHQIAPEKDEQSLSSHLSQIGHEFALHTGTKVTISTSGTEYAVSEQVRLAFTRCLQESLTNSKKHGMASLVEIEICYGREALRLQVADNGVGATELVKGFGLQGMTDRLANLHGSLEVASGPESGTVIVCTVPVVKSPWMERQREGA